MEILIVQELGKRDLRQMQGMVFLRAPDERRVFESRQVPWYCFTV